MLLVVDPVLVGMSVQLVLFHDTTYISTDIELVGCDNDKVTEVVVTWDTVIVGGRTSE